MMNPDFLLKDELAYEIRLMNGSDVGGTDTLRKRYRSLVAANPQVTEFEFSENSAGEELEVILGKVKELEDLGGKLEENFEVGVYRRVDARVNHIFSRKQQLLAYATKEQKQPIIDKLGEVDLRLNMLITRIGNAKAASDLKDIRAAQQTPVVGNLPAGGGQIQDQWQIPQTRPNVDEMTHKFPHLQMQETPRAVQFVNNFSDSCYSKLRNPIEGYLSEIPRTDGLDVNLLLKFFSVLFRIQACLKIQDSQLLQIVFPYTVGALNEKMEKALRLQSSVDALHADVLNSFIPSRLMFVLEQEKFLRLQNSNEPLASYALSIKESVQILRLQKTEEEIVKAIVEGLSPQERQKLIFFGMPRTFEDIEKIAVHSQNVSYIDKQRRVRDNVNVPRNFNPEFPRRSNLNEGDFRRNVRGGAVGNPRRNFEPRTSAPVVCYKCNKVGHFAAECRNRPNQGGNPDRRVVCYTCQRPGHVAKDCRTQKRPNL